MDECHARLTDRFKEAGRWRRFNHVIDDLHIKCEIGVGERHMRAPRQPEQMAAAQARGEIRQRGGILVSGIDVRKARRVGGRCRCGADCKDRTAWQI